MMRCIKINQVTAGGARPEKSPREWPAIGNGRRPGTAGVARLTGTSYHTGPGQSRKGPNRRAAALSSGQESYGRAFSGQAFSGQESCGRKGHCSRPSACSGGQMTALRPFCRCVRATERPTWRPAQSMRKRP